MSYPVLGLRNWNKEFLIKMDGSKVAAGANLLPEGNDGQLHPLSYIFLQPWMIRRRIILQQNWNVGQQ